MSAERDETRIVRSWLEEGVTVLPDRVLDAVLDQLPATPQRRAGWLARRLAPMNTTFRFGIAAAAVAVATLVGFSLITNQVGPSPTATPTPSASASSVAGADIPADLLHPFLGETREAAVAFGGDRSILSFTDRTFALVTGNGEIFRSHASIVDSNVLLLVSQNVAAGCETGAEGRYAFSLSPGGSILTISEGTDACAERAAALPGDWQRSVCKNPDNFCLGNLEAGTYSSQYVEPRPEGEWEAHYGALTFTVPAGWAAWSDFPEMYGIMSQADYADYDVDACADCSANQIALWVAPRAAPEDCSETALPEIGHSPQELAEWVSAHRGLVASPPQEVTIDGRTGLALDIEVAAGWTGTCGEGSDAFTGVPLFFNGYHLVLSEGDRQRVVLLDLGSDDTVVVMIDSRETADLDAFMAEAMPIVESFSFPPR